MKNQNILKELQLVQADMLKSVVKICKENNLEYFLIGGTALGAVRHNGFIPWDDDIDIGMPRESFDKFIIIAKKQLPENLFVQHYSTDKDYLMSFIKIRNSNTTFIQKVVEDLKINHGAFIDIFPLDGVSKSCLLKKIQRAVLNFFTVAIFHKKLPDYYKVNSRSVLFGKFLSLIFSFSSLHRIINKISSFYKYNKCKNISNLFGAWGEKETVPKHYFGAGRLMEFEGELYMVPEKVEDYLKNVYGNYLKLPPIEKRVSHHDTTIIDLNKSYKGYIKNQGEV